MTDQILGLIGITRKASALVVGEDRISEVIQRGRAKLLILPANSGLSARRLAAHAAALNRRLVVVELPYTAELLSHAVGLSNCQIAAITDLGLAKAMIDLLADQNPERYKTVAETVTRRFDKRERRKKEKPGLKKKMKSAGEE